jgi:hypothetical protein
MHACIYPRERERERERDGVHLSNREGANTVPLLHFKKVSWFGGGERDRSRARE